MFFFVFSCFLCAVIICFLLTKVWLLFVSIIYFVVLLFYKHDFACTVSLLTNYQATRTKDNSHFSSCARNKI